jgi:hypothetical protein
MSPIDTPEYKAGWAWATEHGPMLAELFSNKEVSTPEIRVRLFQEASRRWPSDPDDLANDLKQVSFVMGAMKAAIKMLDVSHEALIAANEAGLEMSQLWVTERGKAQALEAIKKKPESWWRTKMGHATPNQVLGALAFAWRVDWAKGEETEESEIPLGSPDRHAWPSGARDLGRCNRDPREQERSRAFCYRLPGRCL